MNWREIDRSELPQWNRHLLRTSASFLQFPYWNEGFRLPHCKPIYLVWGDARIAGRIRVHPDRASGSPHWSSTRRTGETGAGSSDG